MKSVVIFASVIFGLTFFQAAHGQTESANQIQRPGFSTTILSTSFDYDGNSYRFQVSNDDLAHTPSWNPEHDEAPLSPHKAVGIASTALRRFVKTGEEWRVDGVAARHAGAGKWIYDVSFSCSSARCLKDTFPPRFTIVLKMDGTVVEPVIKADEKKND